MPREPALTGGQHQGQENKDPSVTMTSASLSGPEHNSSRRLFRCSRTRWAVGIVAVLLVVAGVAAGVGVYFTVGRNKQGARTPAVAAIVRGPEATASSDMHSTSTGDNRPWLATPVQLWDGVSNAKQSYRILSGPTATWMFAEVFAGQQDAEEFCRSAGGTLAVPSNAVETAEIDQLLNISLPYMVTHAYNVSTDYALWMGLKRTNGVWGTTAGGPLGPNGAVGNYTNWAVGEPSWYRDCSLLAWSWATRKALWAAYVCSWTNMAHAAVCKLPPIAGPGPPVLPKANSLQAPMPVNESDLLVRPSPDFQSATFNMTSPNFNSTAGGRNRRTVMIFSKPLSRADAEEACKRQGSELFVAVDLQDISTMRDAAAKALGLLGRSVLSDIYLGAVKPANSSEWVWGASATAQRGLRLGAFESGVSPWAAGEPGSTVEEEACVVMKVFSNLTFSVWCTDQSCDAKRAYACSSTWW